MPIKIHKPTKVEPVNRGRSTYTALYAAIDNLKKGEYLPVTFDDPDAAIRAQRRLYQHYKNEGFRFRSSTSEDHLTLTFWLESAE